jgi:hypothetical protein
VEILSHKITTNFISDTKIQYILLSHTSALAKMRQNEFRISGEFYGGWQKTIEPSMLAPIG